MMGFIEWTVWGILAPDRFMVWMLLFASVLLHRSREKWGRRIVVGITGLALGVSALPVGDWLLLPLERRFPIPDLAEQQLDGIIVLAGAAHAAESIHRGQPSLTESAERLTEFIGLALRHPEAKLLVSDGAWDSSGHSIGAATAKQLLTSLGLDSLAVQYEENSTSTRENAVFTKALVTPSPGERWALVTSAFHMPRSVGTFRAVGWDVVPYPVDFRSNPALALSFQPARSLVVLATGLREWIALAVYRTLGHTENLLPRP